jgi:N-acetylglucosaminyldiphosphoundecaprenol N-acetyl-beta-D-mannosaminyltransferase
MPYLSDTVKSILSQSYDALEYIVVDAGSTDGTLEYLEGLGDPRVTIIRKDGIGQYDAIDLGLRRARGEVLAWLNADDIYFPWTLSVVEASFKTYSEVQWLTGLPSHIDVHGRCTKIGGAPAAYPTQALRKGWFSPKFLGSVQQESTFWKKDLYEVAGGLDCSYRLAADAQLWGKFAQHADLVTVSVPLAAVRHHQGQRSVTGRDEYAQEILKLQLCEGPSAKLLRWLCERHSILQYSVQLMYMAKTPLLTYDNFSDSWQLVHTRRSVSRYPLSALRAAQDATVKARKAKTSVSADAAPTKLQIEKSPECFEVLGVPFAAVQIPDVIRQVEKWITNGRQTHYITVSNVHSVVESQHDPRFKETLKHADLNVPDGMPIVWLGRSRGHNLPRRVYGPDLFNEFCRDTQGKRYRHFFYGGAPDVAEALAHNVKEKFPGSQVVGYYSPPFRALTSREDLQVIDAINAAEPDVLWIGLGCPKQEFWMHEHLESLQVPAIIGIGQAFDIYAGKLRQAPQWMRESGLEWLFRLLLEPRRLWRRYLVYNTQFIFRLLLESLRARIAN